MTSQLGSPANSTSAELTAAAYEELMEAYSALQIENSRLAAEVTQLKIEIADLSYGRLTNSQTISPDQPEAPEPADADYNALRQTATCRICASIAAICSTKLDSMSPRRTTSRLPVVVGRIQSRKSSLRCQHASGSDRYRDRARRS